MMRVFSICLRTSLLAVVLTSLSAIASGQIIGYPASTDRQNRSPSGQYPNPEGEGPGSVPDPGRQRRRDTTLSRNVYYPRPTRPWPAEVKLTDEQKARLYPSAAEKATFAALLREDGTGIARLLPYVACKDDPRVLNVKDLCLSEFVGVPGRGSFYSFKREKHEAARHADLSLHGTEFRIGFANNGVGLMTMLGDVSLNELTPQSSAIAPLLLLAPAPTLDEMVRLYEQSRSMLASAHHAYDTTFPAQPNTTYVLRSTTYKPNGRKPADILVAFRVTRQDADGSVTIIWKQLRAPKS